MYKITIEKIEDKVETEEVYVTESDRTPEHPGSYQQAAVNKTVRTEMYSQRVETIDLGAVINAVNKEQKV